MYCASAGKTALSPVYSTMQVGTSMSGPHFSNDAFEEIPDHEDSQLSAVQLRAKPMQP
jgi:hypothetical protein